jgi:hypothetical protein
MNYLLPPLPPASATHGAPATGQARDEDADGEELTEGEGAILAALHAQKLTGKQLAEASGLKYNSYFFKSLAALKKKGLVIRHDGGL